MAGTRLAQETTVLAAARAALDPTRAAWQHDILVSTIIEALGRKGPLSRRELKSELALTLVGQEATPTAFSEALERAKGQDLLLMSEGRKGRQVWSLPEGVKAEAATDRQWAEMLLRDTQEQVQGRIRSAFPDDDDLPHRAPRLTKDLVGAMVRASRGVFDAVQHSNSPNDLREVRLNLRSVVPDLRSKVQPPVLADLMAEMLLSAANPDESFGNELLSTIVAGQILHGMVCRDDVVGPMPAARLILDTSQLLVLASYDSGVVELFESFLETASKHGCELVITDRVRKEWDGHWQQADTYYAQLDSKYGDSLGGALKMHRHRVLKEYGYAVERGAKSFASWARERRNLGPIIAKYSITELAVDELALDQDFVYEFAEGIREHQDQNASRVRGLELRYTDGVSAALVRASRLGAPESLVPTAWFVAFDKSSDVVYRSMTEDDFPLVVRASTWLLHYAAFESGEGDSRAEFADRLSEDLILGAFLSVAASYTNDEMLELGDLLSEGDRIDADDVRAFLAEGFLNPEAASEDRVRDFARARLLRQGHRVVRSRQLEGELVRQANAERDAAKALVSALKGTVTDKTDETTVLRRALEAVTLNAALLIVCLLATTLGWFESRVLGLGWLIWCYVVFESVNYVTAKDTTRTQRFAAVGIGLVLAVGAFFVDRNFEL